MQDHPLVSEPTQPAQDTVLGGTAAGGDPQRWDESSHHTLLNRAEKNPFACFSGVPTRVARSRNVLFRSQLVSGVSRHAWQAARFSASAPEPTDSMQTGSEEHQDNLA